MPLLQALPASAVQAPSLFEGNTSYQQELQDLIDKRGTLPELPSVYRQALMSADQYAFIPICIDWEDCCLFLDTVDRAVWHTAARPIQSCVRGEEGSAII